MFPNSQGCGARGDAKKTPIATVAIIHSISLEIECRSEEGCRQFHCSHSANTQSKIVKEP